MNLLSLSLLLVAISTISLIYAKSDDSRDLQGIISFVANYSADFQYIQDTLCLGYPPSIRITCAGKNLTILGYSDPSISCKESSSPDYMNGTTAECTTNCSDCENVYLNKDIPGIRNGPFASIYFACEGDTVQSVEAFINYLGGEDGYCADSSDTFAVTRNIHVARLGISCPVGSSRAYVYDDTYFECSSLVSVEFINAAILGEEDVYSCGDGMNCAGALCTVPFSNLFVIVYLPNILNSCVEATVPITSFPTIAPKSPMYEYSAQFQAKWARLFYPAESKSSCDSGNSVVVVSCGNGATISFIEASDVSIICNPLNEFDLECISDSDTLDNFFVSATFVRCFHYSFCLVF